MDTGQELCIRDLTGSDLVLRLPLRRIMSLVPSVTETVFALGAGAALVGRTRYCVAPMPEVQGVPSMGGTKDPDLQAIVQAAPELVLANREENRRADVQALRDAGVPVYVDEPRSPGDALGMVAQLGVLLGCVEAAAAIVLRGEQVMLAIETERRERAQSNALRLRPRTMTHHSQLASHATFIWYEPWMAAGAQTYIDGMLAFLGLANVFGNAASRYPEVGESEIIAANPDIILLPDEPWHFRQEHIDALARFAPGLAALRHKRVVLCDGRDVAWFGARTPDALVRLWKLLAPML